MPSSAHRAGSDPRPFPGVAQQCQGGARLAATRFSYKSQDLAARIANETSSTMSAPLIVSTRSPSPLSTGRGSVIAPYDRMAGAAGDAVGDEVDADAEQGDCQGRNDDDPGLEKQCASGSR